MPFERAPFVWVQFSSADSVRNQQLIPGFVSRESRMFTGDPPFLTAEGYRAPDIFGLKRTSSNLM